MVTCHLDDGHTPLQRTLTLMLAAKARGNMVAVCRNHYCAQPTSFILRGNFYQRVLTSKERIHSHITQWMANVLPQAHMPAAEEPINPQFAYLYILPKLHKQSIAWRPIVAACNCVTTIPNRALATMLRLVCNTIKAPLVEEFQLTGVRKLWVIENSLEFVLSRPEQIDHIFSSDITNMYSELDQQFVAGAVDQEV